MKEVTLLSSELACLFTLLGAKSAMGVDSASLFPKDALKERVYKSGYDALLRHKWMTKNEESGKHSLKIELLRYVDAVANPKYVISTDIRDETKDEPRRLVHYINRKRVIEQTFLGKAGYRLSDVDEMTLAMLRINAAIGTPKKSRLGNHQAKMSDTVFAQIKSLAGVGKLKKASSMLKKLGLAEKASKAALLSITRPRTCGTISVFELTDRQIDDLNAFAYFIGEGGGWVALKPEPSADDLILRTVDKTHMWGLIASFLGDVMRT